jgi:RHS repeat-associated protein
VVTRNGDVMCGLRDDGPSAARFRDEHGGSGHGPRRKSGGTFPPTRPGTPTQTFRYGLVEGGLPVSFVESASHGQYRCHAHRDYSVVARSYVDGLGRARASLLRSEASNSMGGRRWVKSGIALLTARGTPYRAFDPVYVMTDPPAPFDAVGVPSTPFVRAEYDAFGQVWQSIERDNSPSRVFYKALETVAADALDLGVAGTQNAIGQPSGLAVFQNTFTRSRVDGHGRAIEQVLHQRDPATMEDSYERLATTYRTDGAVLAVTRAETTGPALGTPIRDGRSLTRSFTYDTLGRRLGGTDPDSDGRSGSEATQRWRYLYNRVGDLVAMRDPRGCGQNFYYDRAGRLLAEDYVACAEAQLAGESPDETLPSEAIALGLDTAASSRLVDVRYHFDVDPLWDGFTRPASLDRGRLVGSSDRGQRSLVAYDNRGRTTWSARQMAVIPAAGAAPTTRSGNDPGVYVDDDPSSTDTRVFDVAHTYSTTASYDRIDRSIGRVWPTDPDWALFDGTGSAPVVSASMAFNIRGLPANANLSITASGTTTAIPVLRSVGYDVYGQAANSYFGFQHYGVRRQDTYDVRRRPNRIVLLRTATAGAPPTSFGAVAQILNDYYYWDAANNLVEVRDNRLVGPWPEEQRPQRYRIKHDALYRVASVDYTYRNAANSWTTVGNPATDWRDTQNARVDVDPMRRRPAPRLGDLPDSRVINLTYRYDWLANQTEWTDDSQAFYERSLGSTIRNGYTEGQPNGGALRPTALYLAAQLPESPSSPIDPAVDRGGWVRVRYGESGNATSVTVRARCHDVSAATACWDDAGEQDVDQRAAQLLSTCRCDQEQHYEYRWDELNRLAEARRYDRAGSGDWALQVRQRYRYDAGNIRTLKETVDGQTADPSGNAVGGVERVALYVMPGDFERRGLVTNRITDTYDASLALGTETQYLVAGARVVWKPGAVGGGGTGFDRDARVTLAMTNLLQSTAGVVDLVSGELLEVATYYPNGARETLRANSDVEEFALEPVGFTGKEDDSEVGLVYFGMRYLMPHLGRWASPDPLQIHAGGGGEFGNSYHYVSGNLLQARDPLGLDGCSSSQQCCEEAPRPMTGSFGAGVSDGNRYARSQVAAHYANAAPEVANADAIHLSPGLRLAREEMWNFLNDRPSLLRRENGQWVSSVGALEQPSDAVQQDPRSYFEGRREGARRAIESLGADGAAYIAHTISERLAVSNQTLGAGGEAVVGAILRSWGLGEPRSIQNSSGHGLDGIMRIEVGRQVVYLSWEVKTSRGDRAPRLSSAQGDMVQFTMSRLQRMVSDRTVPAADRSFARRAIQELGNGALLETFVARVTRADGTSATRVDVGLDRVQTQNANIESAMRRLARLRSQVRQVRAASPRARR